MKKFFIGFACAVIFALCNTSCIAKPAEAKSSAAEQVASFMGLAADEAGTVKAAPGNVYVLGTEDLPGNYAYTQIDEQTISISCHGLVFKFENKSRNGDREMTLPSGPKIGNYPKFEVKTTSCFFTVEFLSSGQKQLTIYQ